MPGSKSVLVAGLLLSGALISGCHPKKLSDAIGEGAHISTADTLNRPVNVVAKLDCPQTEGGLTLTSAAPDGRACAYRSNTGVVTLTLAEGASEEAALAPFRAEVDAALPRQAKGASATVSVSSDHAVDGGKVDRVDMPFLHIRDDGHRAHVQILGMSIDEDSHRDRHHADADDDKDDDDSAAANSEGASTSVSVANGRESVYLLAGDPPTREGYHAVGFVARGDGKGRAVVALFKSRNGDSDNRNHDLNALLDLNAPKG